MRKRFFKPITVRSATFLIAITSFASYAIGLLRDNRIAVTFGTTNATDTYNASFLIPDILFNLFIAGALAAAFLPIFSEQLTKDKKEAYRLANTMITCGTLLIAGLAILAFIFMDFLIPFAFPDINPASQQDIINMTRLMLPSAILFAISNTLGNILMSYKHFVAYALSPIFYNLGIILGVTLLSGKFGIYSAVIGVLTGAAFHCLIRIIETFSTDYRYKPGFNVKDPNFKKIIKLMIPKSIGLIAWQLNLYIFASVGMKIVEGGLSAFNYARNIQSFAVSLFGISFATAVFPFLTNAISKGDKKTYTSRIQQTLQRTLFFTIPAMFGVMVLSKEIVEIILSGGVFGEKSVILTKTILFFFAISIPFESMVHTLARGFYALQNTITPMIINITAMTLIALSTIFVAPVYGIKWFSIGFSIGLSVQVGLLAIFLSRHLQNFQIKKFIISISKIFVASLVMIIVIKISSPLADFIMPKIAHTLRIAIGGISFLITAFLIKSPEISSIKTILSFSRKRESNLIWLISLIIIIILIIILTPKVEQKLRIYQIEKQNQEALELAKKSISQKISEITPPHTIPDSSYIEVPFICQAPLETEANWVFHEESCEEAATLQAYLYETNQTMTKQEAHEEIMNMRKWQHEKFGGHFDLYADQMKEFITGYYGIGEDKIKIIRNASIQDIKQEISNNHPVIAPITGDILKNPYYPYPGYHMLTVIGYTEDKIITNDNGTRRGADFSYPVEIFEAALQHAEGDVLVFQNLENTE